jgi:hypothetical protein
VHRASDVFILAGAGTAVDRHDVSRGTIAGEHFAVTGVALA